MTLLRSKKALLALSVLLALVLWYQSGTRSEPIARPVQTETRTVVADALTIDDLKAEFARTAVRAARLGCANVGERLSGEPTRVLVSLTQSTVAHRFISPGSKLGQRMGPGFIGSEAALVVAVEGPVESESDPGDRQSSSPRSFVFVEPVGAPEFTTCVMRESPLLLNQTDFLYGSFEFELYEIR